MKSIITTMIAIAALLTISACGLTPKTEIPQDGEGSDAMRQSPCVGAAGSPCAPIEYDGRGFIWRT